MFSITLYPTGEGSVVTPRGFAHRSTALDAAFAAIDTGRYISVSVYEDGVKVGHCNVHGWFPTKDSIVDQPLKETMNNELTRKDLEELTRKYVEELRQLRTKVLEIALNAVTKALFDVPGMDAGTWKVEDVVLNADAIRDALQPFDSGDRPTVVCEPVPTSFVPPTAAVGPAAFTDGVKAALNIVNARMKGWDNVIDNRFAHGRECEIAKHEATVIAGEIQARLLMPGGEA